MSPLAEKSLSTNNLPSTHTNSYELYLTLLVCHAYDNHTPEGPVICQDIFSTNGNFFNCLDGRGDVWVMHLKKKTF